MKPQHYNPTKPTRIIMDFPTGDNAIPGLPEGLCFATDANNEPYVFGSLAKAQKHASHSIDINLHKYINYVNDTPQAGWGDRQETGNKRCLKCKSFLRPGNVERSALGGHAVEHRVLLCPQCDNLDPQ